MKFFATGILVLLIALLLSAGCTQSAPSPQQTMVPTTAPPAITPAVIVPTSVPQVTVTVIHYIVPTKLWKDSDLHISFAAPPGSQCHHPAAESPRWIAGTHLQDRSSSQ